MRLHALQGGLHFGMVSGAFLLAFGVCETLHQLSHFETAIEPHPHAVFLPHGVIVLVAWMYGWAAFPLLLPAVLLAFWLLAGSVVFDPLIMTIIALKLAAVPLAFDLFRLGGLDVRGVGTAANWKALVAVGLLGSMLGNMPRVMAGPCCVSMDAGERLMVYANAVAGDMAGLIVVLLVVMMVFRVLRHD